MILFSRNFIEIAMQILWMFVGFEPPKTPQLSSHEPGPAGSLSCTHRRQRWHWWAGSAGRGAGRPQAPRALTGRGGPCGTGRWPARAAVLAVPWACPQPRGHGAPPPACAARCAPCATGSAPRGHGWTWPRSWDRSRGRSPSRSAGEHTLSKSPSTGTSSPWNNTHLQTDISNKNRNPRAQWGEVLSH